VIAGLEVNEVNLEVRDRLEALRALPRSLSVDTRALLVQLGVQGL
jgi:hypothetical protein